MAAVAERDGIEADLAVGDPQVSGGLPVRDTLSGSAWMATISSMSFTRPPGAQHEGGAEQRQKKAGMKASTTVSFSKSIAHIPRVTRRTMDPAKLWACQSVAKRCTRQNRFLCLARHPCADFDDAGERQVPSGNLSGAQRGHHHVAAILAARPA